WEHRSDAGGCPNPIGDTVPAEVDGGDRFDNRLCDSLRILDRAVGEKHNELVSAETRRQVIRPTTAADGLGDFLQQRVACGVAGTIIDRLETIKIDEAKGILPAFERDCL